MYVFLRTLFALIGFVATIFVVTALWWDLHQMDPDNGYFRKGETRVLAGESISFENVDATPTGYVRRGLLLDLHLECRSGGMSLEFFKWRLDVGKMAESDVQLHKPQAACKKRGLQTLF